MQQLDLTVKKKIRSFFTALMRTRQWSLFKSQIKSANVFKIDVNIILLWTYTAHRLFPLGFPSYNIFNVLHLNDAFYLFGK